MLLFQLGFQIFDTTILASSDTAADEFEEFTPEKSGVYIINVGGGGSVTPDPTDPSKYFGIQYGGYLL